MSSKDVVPHADGKFHVWQMLLMENVGKQLTNWKIPEEEFQKIKELQLQWNKCYEIAANRHNRTSADVCAKNDARQAYEKPLRNFIGFYLASRPYISNAEREILGLTIRSERRKAPVEPQSFPVATVLILQGAIHRIKVSDSKTPHKKAKPYSIQGFEVWMKTGAEPVHTELDFSYQGTFTRTPCQLNHAKLPSGTPVQYRLRWVNTRGEAGPWSATYQAMVLG
jgi:hypothetical protein